MGPNIIFDKSFLQSLNLNESVWLDAFFCTVITPIFFVETLADLEKKPRRNLNAKKLVSSLAAKTPDWSAYSNVHHLTLVAGELLGRERVDVISRRPVVGGGKHTKLEGQAGIVFEQSPEEEALNRWFNGQFLDIERQQAKKWRKELTMIEPKSQEQLLANWFADSRPSSLVEVKAAADKMIDTTPTERALNAGLSLLGCRTQFREIVLQRWKSTGAPSLHVFCPYFAHVFRVELFFYLARAAHLISDRRTNKVDVAYIYYLPFCHVFTSKDNLHRDIVPLFLKANQEFIWGPDLKKDLARLDSHYSGLPDDIKGQGTLAFASRPPADTSFLVTRIWDKYMKRDWRKSVNAASNKSNKPFERNLVERIRRAVENADSSISESSSDIDQPDFVVTKHFVSSRKGKWRRFSNNINKGSNDK